jgi:4-amino-4-deoxy-L-arabinose transferase-like glycosyltransferase
MAHTEETGRICVCTDSPGKTAHHVDYAKDSICPLSGWLTLRWLATLAFLHGMLYVFIVPPWQHYDEPTHFEYAALIALLERRPSPAISELDPTINRAIAESMYRFRFWSPDNQPDLTSNTDQPLLLGYNQRVHPPLYYALISWPIRWLQEYSVEMQLYGARLVSVGLYVLTIIVAWRLSTILAAETPLFHVMFPLLVMIVPAFSDLMSAVNNDVLVNFSAATLLLGCVFLIRDGMRPLPLLLVFLSFGIGLLTKRSAVIMILPLVLALFWTIQRHPISWWLWIIGVVGVSLLIGVGGFRYETIDTVTGTQSTIVLRSWLADLNQHYLRLSFEKFFQSITDWETNQQVYPVLFERIFMSFWLRFAWGHVMMGRVWEFVMLGVVLFSSVGLIIWSVRDRQYLQTWRQRCILLFFLAVIAAWVLVFARYHSEEYVYFPVGRYLYTVMLPTIWLLLLGWHSLVGRRWPSYSVPGLLFFFVLLDTTAWAYTLVDFYYRW